VRESILETLKPYSLSTGVKAHRAWYQTMSPRFETGYQSLTRGWKVAMLEA